MSLLMFAFSFRMLLQPIVYSIFIKFIVLPQDAHKETYTLCMPFLLYIIKREYV